MQKILDLFLKNNIIRFCEILKNIIMQKNGIKNISFALLDKFKQLFRVDKNNEKYLYKISKDKKASEEDFDFVISNPNITIPILLSLGNNPSITKNILLKIAGHDKSYDKNGNLIFMQNNNIYNKVQSYNDNFVRKFSLIVNKKSFNKKIQNNINDLMKDPVKYLKDINMDKNINNFIFTQEIIHALKDLPYDIKIKILQKLGLFVENNFAPSKNKKVFEKNNSILIQFYSNPTEFVKEKQQEQEQVKVQEVVETKGLLNNFQLDMYYNKIENEKAKTLIDQMASQDFVNSGNDINNNIKNKLHIFSHIFLSKEDRKNSVILINDLFDTYKSMGLTNSDSEHYFKDNFMKEQKDLIGLGENHHQNQF